MGEPAKKDNVVYLDAYRAAREAKRGQGLVIFLDDGSEVDVDFGEEKPLEEAGPEEPPC